VKEFSCGLVMPGCDARFEADDDDQILAQVAAHAKADHGLEVVPADVVATVRGLIKPVG
jgi:predicted small metal-binding protein